jgi:hypothetical protein
MQSSSGRNVLIALVVAIFSSGIGVARAQDSGAPSLDPAIWGVYARMVGRDWMQ